MQTTITDEISALNSAIEDRIGQQRFRVWFRNSTRFSLSEDYLKVGVPNPFIGNWIETHFLRDINEALLAVTGSSRKVAFSVEP